MIIFTHHTGEPHGILGAQAAATFFTHRLGIPSIVVGILREFDAEALFRFVEEHYHDQARVATFSHLCGRKDLVALAEELKQRGFRNILGGPQARADYYGEDGQDVFPHRFKGLKHCVDLAIQGPIDLLTEDQLKAKGCIELPWTKNIDLEVDWSNLYVFSDSLYQMDIRLPQVLQAIGCQYANRQGTVALPPPSILKDRLVETSFASRGCVFCDVARDKGFHGQVEEKVLISQLHALPDAGARKVHFELIDEYPIRSLRHLFLLAERENIHLSQVNLVCRVDDINTHSDELEEALKVAQSKRMSIMFSSIGFESFSDRILTYLNKGINVQDNLACARILRDLKARYRDTLLYWPNEGAVHGFIHPTPWDDEETLSEMNMNMYMYGLFKDVLPEHSIPLIIHHASCLGDWIRSIEEKAGVRFGRDGNWIEWWNLLEA
ncbi:MAG: hypothetical protein NT010_08725 [Proteobacteria bacterium]|nr:hypothetical protein [Pseudomonadota bacterium]